MSVRRSSRIQQIMDTNDQEPPRPKTISLKRKRSDKSTTPLPTTIATSMHEKPAESETDAVTTTSTIIDITTKNKGLKKATSNKKAKAKEKSMKSPKRNKKTHISEDNTDSQNSIEPSKETREIIESSSSSSNNNYIDTNSNNDNGNEDNALEVNDHSVETTEKFETVDRVGKNSIDHSYEEIEGKKSEETKEYMNMLSTVIDLQNLNTFSMCSFSRDKKVIEEALRINEELQNLIEAQIDKIDNRLKKNEELTKKARSLSICEARNKRKRIDIHKPYEKGFDYFKEFHGVSLPDNEENQENMLDIERSKAWQVKERELLSTAIQTEVQRTIAYGHLSRNEAWRVWEVDKIPRKEWENFPVDRLDWNRISSLYVKTRTPMECMIQWTTQDHPAINKTPWSKKESERLAELVREYGHEGQWVKIASDLNTNRTASQCFSHYQAECNALSAKRPWTKEDDEALKEAVTLVGDKSWQQVATLVGGRSGQQCLHRWLKSINPAIKRSRWTEEEDNALRGAVEVYGVGNWTSVQRYIPGRTDMQCRERWMNCLDPRINHEPFTLEEHEKLMELVQRHGKKWAYLTQFMPGRTDNHLLRQWRSTQKPPGSKTRKKKETTAAS